MNNREIPKDIGLDTPLRLDVAARVAFPGGGMTASGLRREAARGRLQIERIAGKDYTTWQPRVLDGDHGLGPRPTFWHCVSIILQISGWAKVRIRDNGTAGDKAKRAPESGHVRRRNKCPLSANNIQGLLGSSLEFRGTQQCGAR